MNGYAIKSNNITMKIKDREYVLKVKDLPENKKPREKLIKHGPTLLEANELLAVILKVGTKKEEVLQMSSRIFKEYGEKTIISQTDPKELVNSLDIPLDKACQIVACFELGKRFFQKLSKGGPITIRNAKQAFEHLTDMRNLNKEHFRGLYLNSRYRLIHDEIISIGTLTANVVHPREVFKPALFYSAVAVIVAHNHPSGSLKPTESDIKVTNTLIESGKILGINLLDHIIIGKNKYKSII